MKSLKLIAALLLLTGFILSSCSKDEKDLNPVTTGTMTAKIDGTDWSASLGAVATSGTDIVTVTGSGASADQLQVVVVDATGTGTYDIGGLSNFNTARWTNGLDPMNDVYSANFVVGSGSVTLTTLTATRVERSFTFTAANVAGGDVTVTSGSFASDISQ